MRPERVVEPRINQRLMQTLEIKIADAGITIGDSKIEVLMTTMMELISPGHISINGISMNGEI